jgi:GGDEF domain-containing protein
MRIALIDMSAAAHPLLRSPHVRLVLVAAPAVTAMAAISVNYSPNLLVGILLSAAAGVAIATALFMVLSALVRELSDERVLLAHSLEEEHWHARAQRLSSQHHRNGRLYADWYFRLRLQEEVERAERYNVPFTLLIAKVPARPARGSAEEWLKTQVEQHLRRTDLPAVLRDGSLGVLLHHTAHFNAVRDRLTDALAAAAAGVGFAVFPKDGADVSSLLRAADTAANEDARQRLARPAA